MSTLYVPLAERMRPQTLDDVLGQEKLLRKKRDNKMAGILRTCIAHNSIPSMVLWGPPGTGKTTIARLVACSIKNCTFVPVSAVSSGIGDLKKIFTHAVERRDAHLSTCVFIDEIHRFNKAQQDPLLHYVEEGVIILIGATTENPSFEINSALLSRVQVFVLEPLKEESLQILYKKTEEKLGENLRIEEEAKSLLFHNTDGDARKLLNMMEQLYVLQKEERAVITKDVLWEALANPSVLYDKGGEQHYNLISCLHKSIRGSDCDAALYWLSRMLLGGEGPRYIFRRLLRMSYEDIGLADMHASSYVLTAWKSYERVGSPEGELALASSVIYLALCPKSNRSYVASQQAMRTARTYSNAAPPKHILNAPTPLMRKLDYGKGYIYEHDTEDGVSGQGFFPEEMEPLEYYHPVERGFEREMKKRLEYFKKKRKSL